MLRTSILLKWILRYLYATHYIYHITGVLDLGEPFWSNLDKNDYCIGNNQRLFLYMLLDLAGIAYELHNVWVSYNSYGDIHVFPYYRL